MTVAATGEPTTVSPAPGTLEAVLVKNREKAKFEPPREPAAAPAPKTAEVAIDAAALAKVTRLERQAVDDKAKIAALETTAKETETLVQVRKLYAEGKKLEAIALLSGADPTQEMEALLEQHLAAPTEETETALAAQVKALSDKIDADEQARKDAETARVAAEAEANTVAFAMHALDTATNDDGTAKYELCARPENRQEAAKLAIEHAGALAVARGIDPETLTPDTTRALLQDAYADVEAELEAEGVAREAEIAKRFKKAPKATPLPAVPARAAAPTAQPAGPPAARGDQVQQTGQQTSRPQPIPKPGLVTQKPKPAYTLEAVLQKNRERARY